MKLAVQAENTGAVHVTLAGADAGELIAAWFTEAEREIFGLWG